MVGAAAKPLPETYRRREPEKTVLHQVVREHLETLLMESRAEGSGLPRYVEEEFRRYLECGILAAGFARCVCAQCGDELLVAFICKGKGFCPSCLARRMNDTAAPSRSRAARGAVSAMGDGVSAAAPLGICARSEGCRTGCPSHRSSASFARSVSMARWCSSCFRRGFPTKRPRSPRATPSSRRPCARDSL